MVAHTESNGGLDNDPVEEMEALGAHADNDDSLHNDHVKETKALGAHAESDGGLLDGPVEEARPWVRTKRAKAACTLNLSRI